MRNLVVLEDFLKVFRTNLVFLFDNIEGQCLGLYYAKSQEYLAHGYHTQGKTSEGIPQNCTIFCTKSCVAENFPAEALNFFQRL